MHGLQACLPMDCSPPGSSVHEVSPGKNTGVGCHALFQGIFPTQGSYPCILHLLHYETFPLVARKMKRNLEGKGIISMWPSPSDFDCSENSYGP